MADSALFSQLRRQLRARRLAEKQAQMAAALAEKQARDVKESTREGAQGGSCARRISSAWLPGARCVPPCSARQSLLHHICGSQ